MRVTARACVVRLLERRAIVVPLLVLLGACRPERCHGEPTFWEGNWTEAFPDHKVWPGEDYGVVTGELLDARLTLSYSFGVGSAWEVPIELEQPLPCVPLEREEESPHDPLRCVTRPGAVDVGEPRRTAGTEGDPAEQQALWAKYTVLSGCDGYIRLVEAGEAADFVAFLHPDNVEGISNCCDDPC